MGILDEYTDTSRFLNLASAKENEIKKAKDYTRPKTVDTTTYLNRYSKEVIRDLMLHDWFTFSTVNLCANTYARPKFTILSKNAKSIKEWNTFFDEMSKYGTNTSLRRLRAELKRDAVGFGSGFLEYVYDTTGQYILDLKRVDASIIEHARDKKGKLILDSFGMSIGYVLHLGLDKDPLSKGDEIPFIYKDIIHMLNGDIFLKPDRIAEFPLYKLGNDTEAIGLVEPAIVQAQRRMKLETAEVNALWIRGTSPLFTYVGDPTHEPTPQMMEDAVDAITELRHSQAMAFPYYNKVDSVKVEMDGSMKDVMSSLMFGQAGAAGAPMPFVTSQGEATNRSTLATQKENFELNMQSFIDNFDEDWNNQVMKKVALVNGFQDAVIISEKISLGDKLEFSQRISSYLLNGLMSKKEARETLFKHEEFERDDSSYEKELKEKEEKDKEMLENTRKQNQLNSQVAKTDDSAKIENKTNKNLQKNNLINDTGLDKK